MPGFKINSELLKALVPATRSVNKDAEALHNLYAQYVAKGKINDAESLLNRLFLEKSNTRYLTPEGTVPVLYHGSPHTFNQFNPEKIGSANDPGFYGRGFYFSPEERIASGYGDPKKYFVRFERPFVADTPEKSKASLLYNNDDYLFDMMYPNDSNLKSLYEGALKNADGVIHKTVAPIRGDNKIINEIISPNPNNIKFAGVTYDNNGNLIPLWERFNFENPDLRYRTGGKLYRTKK